MDKERQTFPCWLQQPSYNKQWLGGGTSNIAGNFGLNYDFNYKRISFGTINLYLLMAWVKLKAINKQQKTDDRLELNSQEESIRQLVPSPYALQFLLRVIRYRWFRQRWYAFHNFSHRLYFVQWYVTGKRMTI
jgi:hypothetical protein